MNSKQLNHLIGRIDALKTPDTSAEFQAGVDAAKELVDTIAQEALDQERMQKLEAELNQLRAKYPAEGQAAPKKRGRKPKTAQVQEEQPQGSSQA